MQRTPAQAAAADFHCCGWSMRRRLKRRALSFDRWIVRSKIDLIGGAGQTPPSSSAGGFRDRGNLGGERGRSRQPRAGGLRRTLPSKARPRDAARATSGRPGRSAGRWGSLLAGRRQGREDIIAEELRQAARRSANPADDRVDVEDILDVIFRDFCVWGSECKKHKYRSSSSNEGPIRRGKAGRLVGCRRFLDRFSPQNPTDSGAISERFGRPIEALEPAMFHVKHRRFDANKARSDTTPPEQKPMTTSFDADRDRRRPRGCGRGRSRPHGRENRAGHASIRDRRSDVVTTRQSAGWGREGHLVREIDALDGRMGRLADPGRGPVPCPQPPQGPAVSRTARAGGPGALRRGDAGCDPRDGESQRDRGRSRRSGHRRSGSDGRAPGRRP